MAVYKRVILKLSGEALKSDNGIFDFDKINETAQIIKRIHDMGVQTGIVIGAGNIWRGRQGPSASMDAVSADQMGMLGTMINCICMADALRRAGLDAVVQSAVDMNRFAEPYNTMAARRHLDEGRVVLFGGGTGNPFFSTDSGIVLRAIEMNADCVLLAKNIDGVYTADPMKDPDAKLIKDLTYADAIAKGLKVMDTAAFALCADNHIPMVRVFGLDDPENLIRVLEGDDMGTFVHP
ncbi:MAG: UMP kinase [Clostridia bacterium]|nr:UMP kinase [Clostridia bacterium]